MRRVVIADQMKRLVLRRFTVNLSQEVEPLDMAVALRATGNDCAVEHAHRSKQGSGAVALVVMRHRGCAALLHRQTRLRAVKRLYLALLIAAQHQGVLGRGRIQANDVFELLDELGIARHLELLCSVRLQAALFPNALYGGVAHTSHRRQRAGAPLGRRFGLSLRGEAHDLHRIDRGFAPTARQVFFDSLSGPLARLLRLRNLARGTQAFQRGFLHFERLDGHLN